MGELEQLYSARSAPDYDRLKEDLHRSFTVVAAPPDVLDRALALQRDLAHQHGSVAPHADPDLLIAETALHHELGVVHVDGDFDRMAEVRRLPVGRSAEKGWARPRRDKRAMGFAWPLGDPPRG